MADGNQVVTPTLTTHVRALTDLTGELNTALSAAQVTVTGDSYGQTGARFAAGLAGVSTAGQDTLRAAIDALDKAAAAMRATVTAYDRQEQASRDAFNRLDGEGQ